MAETHHIRNPFEMAIEQLSWAATDAEHAVVHPPHLHAPARPVAIRRIGVSDVWQALRQGAGDLGTTREDVVFAALVYPLAGLVLAQVFLNHDLLPLIFPLASGFALLGPLAAVGVYEVSRRHEQGRPVTWRDLFGVLRSPAMPSIFGLGLILLAIFLVWIAAADAIYAATLGPAPPASLGSFLREVVGTSAGWTMIVLGVGVGFLFAVAALAVSVISFPLLLDRGGGVWRAVTTSVLAVAANPGPMALWGLIVAVALVLGSLPALFGLILVVPLLGHATWRLYRKVITGA